MRLARRLLKGEGSRFGVTTSPPNPISCIIFISLKFTGFVRVLHQSVSSFQAALIAAARSEDGWTRVKAS